ncbi:MAG: hydrogenase maturation nickel metallochaperone HypA [Deltaproteobacteria bacterium]|nr:hydrogenase maturation nickel metallochaperone HypA [Deltaproteobacteria bacterium]
MHEGAITENLVSLVLEQARAADARSVTRVVAVVGRLSGVVPEAMAFWFRELTRETPAEGAVLDVREIPGRARCLACGELYEVDDAPWPCPACGAGGPEIVEGRELFLESLEVD